MVWEHAQVVDVEARARRRMLESVRTAQVVRRTLKASKVGLQY